MSPTFKLQNMKVFLLLAILIPFHLMAQNQYDIKLKPIHITEMAGIQSYAFGQHDGKILIIGGRLDGLHRKQPWASFDEAGHNRQLWVIDPNKKKVWNAI